MSHCKQLEVAKRKASALAKAMQRDIPVVSARAGYYYGPYPNPAPEAVVFVAKAEGK